MRLIVLPVYAPAMATDTPSSLPKRDVCEKSSWVDRSLGACSRTTQPVEALSKRAEIWCRSKKAPRWSCVACGALRSVFCETRFESVLLSIDLVTSSARDRDRTSLAGLRTSAPSGASDEILKWQDCVSMHRDAWRTACWAYRAA